MKLGKVTFKLIKLCPMCGSGDVSWCNISDLPHCNECRYWAPNLYCSENKQIADWNNKVILWQGVSYSLGQVNDQGYITFSENIGYPSPARDHYYVYIAEEKFW